MTSIKVYLEIGNKRAIASAIDWPGWSRSGRDEESALQALIDYAPRYAQVLRNTDIAFKTSDVSRFVVTERLAGNATTDFGVTAIIRDADRAPIGPKELIRSQTILLACWRTFDRAAQKAKGKELRKGPRGGGRDLEKILQHVPDADQEYLKRLGWKQKYVGEKNLASEIAQTREAILDALELAVEGELPKQGPRGGVIWPPRYFVRRVAWHVLDHAWEIQDRMV